MIGSRLAPYEIVAPLGAGGIDASPRPDLILVLRASSLASDPDRIMAGLLGL